MNEPSAMALFRHCRRNTASHRLLRGGIRTRHLAYKLWPDGGAVLGRESRRWRSEGRSRAAVGIPTRRQSAAPMRRARWTVWAVAPAAIARPARPTPVVAPRSRPIDGTDDVRPWRDDGVALRAAGDAGTSSIPRPSPTGVRGPSATGLSRGRSGRHTRASPIPAARNPMSADRRSPLRFDQSTADRRGDADQHRDHDENGRGAQRRVTGSVLEVLLGEVERADHHREGEASHHRGRDHHAVGRRRRRAVSRRTARGGEPIRWVLTERKKKPGRLMAHTHEMPTRLPGSPPGIVRPPDHSVQPARSRQRCATPNSLTSRTTRERRAKRRIAAGTRRAH